jgi:hypothetical protein
VAEAAHRFDVRDPWGDTEPAATRDGHCRERPLISLSVGALAMPAMPKTPPPCRSRAGAFEHPGLGGSWIVHRGGPVCPSGAGLVDAIMPSHSQLVATYQRRIQRWTRVPPMMAPTWA